MDNDLIHFQFQMDIARMSPKNTSKIFLTYLSIVLVLLILDTIKIRIPSRFQKKLDRR